MYAEADLENKIPFHSHALQIGPPFGREKEKLMKEVKVSYCLNHGLTWVFGPIIAKVTVGCFMPIWVSVDWKQF